MMMIKHLAFQLMPLAISFGVGYWILITANAQEGLLKAIGKFLGWVLIVMALLVSIFSFYYSKKMSNRGCMYEGHHMYKMMDNKGMPAVDKEEKGENESLQKNKNGKMMDEEENEDLQKDENVPEESENKTHK